MGLQSRERTTWPLGDEQPAARADGRHLAPIRVRQRYEHVAERLLADVAAGRLEPGERLPSERDLARRLGVGRASVREALAALQNEGVLETRPGSGSFVAPGAAERVRGRDLPHDASPSDVLEARALFEPAVARLAAARAHRDAEAEDLLGAMEAAVDLAGARKGAPDPRARAVWSETDRLFHRRIAAMTGNPVLLALADLLAARMDEPLWRRLRDESVATPGRTRLHAAEHRMIYEAVAEGDGAAAELYAAQHIRRVRRYMTLDQEDAHAL